MLHNMKYDGGDVVCCLQKGVPFLQKATFLWVSLWKLSERWASRCMYRICIHRNLGPPDPRYKQPVSEADRQVFVDKGASWSPFIAQRREAVEVVHHDCCCWRAWKVCCSLPVMMGVSGGAAISLFPNALFEIGHCWEMWKLQEVWLRLASKWNNGNVINAELTRELVGQGKLEEVKGQCCTKMY